MPSPSVFAPLKGVRVLDLSRYLPGPYLTRILCDLGAEVVSVEAIQGEGMRYMPPRVDGIGATFGALHADKDSLALNLKKPEGKAVLAALAKEADVMVEAFRPGKLAALGFGFEALQAINPGLILCSITGFGQTGSNAQTAGHDLNYVATAGLLNLFGPAGSPPTVPGVQLADIVGGSLPAAIGILGALMERQQTGVGRHLDINMTLGALALGAQAYPAIAAGASEPRGQGMLTGGAPAYRCYETQDGQYVALAGMEPHFFATFCHLVDRPQWAEFSYRTDIEGARVAKELEALFKTRPLQAWLDLVEGHDICLTAVRTPQEAMADPDFEQAIHKVGGLTLVSSSLGAPTAAPSRPPSALGADAPSVMKRWGVEGDVHRAAVSAQAMLWPTEA